MKALVKEWWRFALFVVLPLVLLAILLGRLEGLPAAQRAVRTLQHYAHEWWALPLFAAVYVAFAVLFLPVGILAAAAALAWGWKLGGTIELCTSTAAAVVPYLLARGPFAAFIEKKLARLGTKTPSFADDDGAFALLLLRIVPVIPYVALNYLAGLARVPLRAFVLTTFAGSIPSVFVFAYFVDAMAAGATGQATYVRLAIASGAFLLLAVAGRALAKRFGARLK